jgi:hypothetical protein
MNQEQHPRQSLWSNQFIIETFSMFKTQDEWDEFDKMPKNSGQNLKKRTPIDVGIAVPYVVWAKAIWAKWLKHRSHMVNVVNVDFRNLLTKGGRPKSGIQTADVVEQLRMKYFEEWCTTTNGVVTHLARPISECPDWVPGAWWHSWIALGAPQGEKACAPLSSLDDSSAAQVGDSQDLPNPLNDLLTAQFQGRKEQREKKMTSEDVQKDAKSSSNAPLLPSSLKKGSEKKIKTFEAHLKERDAQMNRLHQLIDFPGLDPEAVKGFKQELLLLMLKPIVTLETCGRSPFSPACAVVITSATVTDDEIVPIKLFHSDAMSKSTAKSAQSALDHCIEASTQPETVTADAAVKFGLEQVGQIHSKTTAFHTKIVPVSAQNAPLFQQNITPSNESFVFTAQRGLHIDSGYDPEFWTANEDYTILSLDDVLANQPGFLIEFKTKFNIHFEDSEIQAEFAGCHARDTLFFAFATLVNDRSSRSSLGGSFEFETIKSMRTCLFKTIKANAGNIPGSNFNFEDERSYALDFHGNIVEYLKVQDRGGDPLFIHAFCHMFEFDIVLFSVKDPGGTIYTNKENGNVDVCSILHELNVEDDLYAAHDKFYLAVPKAGAVAGAESASSFFCNDEKDHEKETFEKAETIVTETYASLLQVRNHIAQCNANVRFRRDDVNRRLKEENEKQLKAAQAAYDSALLFLQKLQYPCADIAESSQSASQDDVSVHSAPSAPDDDSPHNPRVVDVVVRPAKSLALVFNEFEEFYKFQTDCPEYTVDIEIAFVSIEIGRGIRAMRRFKKGSFLGHYGGHRCDPDGKVIIRDAETDALFNQFQHLNLDRQKTGAIFQKTHALCLGQTHLSGLVIDGYPLCDPSLDNIRNKRGAFAAANSAASASAANAKPLWLKSPQFKPDRINNLADRVCVFMAKDDIE